MKWFILAGGIRGFLPREVTDRQSQVGFGNGKTGDGGISGRGHNMSKGKKLGNNGSGFPEVDEDKLDEDEQ